MSTFPVGWMIIIFVSNIILNYNLLILSLAVSNIKIFLLDCGHGKDITKYLYQVHRFPPYPLGYGETLSSQLKILIALLV